jgi:hypothetical protein
MTPSVAAASPTVAPAAPLAAVRTTVHDREWWAVEAIRAGTDWSGLVAVALEMMVAAGIIELEPEPEIMSHWDAPTWREAAIEYHRDRHGCLAIDIEPKRLARLRRLMADDVSLERAWHELQDTRPPPVVVVEALKLAVRARGPKVLNEPVNQERIKRCDANARDRLDRWIADFEKRNCL